MAGKVTFVGAGPGAVDLITLRGLRALEQADVVVYAGSLVNEALLSHAPHAELHNSAKMSLDEVLALLEDGYRAGKHVVRLHTGDPSVYGATSEQYRALDERGVPFEVVPGVSSAFAAAAALHVELTMPNVSQSVILTREAGRTPVPPQEALTALATHGTTLCIFLSVSEMERLVQELLLAGRPLTTPVAVVYRASWENERIVRGTLADIASKVREAGIRRQSMIVVGEVLNRAGDLSSLYDREFETGFRHADRGGFHGACALFALTHDAALKAAEIATGLDHATVFVPEKHASLVPEIRRQSYPDGTFAETFHAAWTHYDAFVMVMAAGIVTRQLSDLAADKRTDPAVVVCDEAGAYAIPLLSGHIGGANLLAQDIARITGGQAVLTTASDVRNLPALDAWAARNHYRILTPEALNAYATAVLAGKPVALSMPQALFRRDFAECPQFSLAGELVGGIVEARVENIILRLERERLHLGIGCRRGISEERLQKVIPQTLEQFGYSVEEVCAVATADVKREEAGLLAFARSRGLPLRFFEAEKLNAVEVPNPSRAAWQHLGLRSVSEAAALLSAGTGAKLVLEKQACADVTVALAKEVAP